MQLQEATYKVYKDAVTKFPSGMQWYNMLLQFHWLFLSSADMYEKMIGWCLERLHHNNVVQSSSSLVILLY